MKPVLGVTLSRGPVRLVPLTLEHEAGGVGQAFNQQGVHGWLSRRFSGCAAA